MRKILMFGNSSSGKSSLARKISKAEKMGHLDLDSIAWLRTTPPQRAQLGESVQKIRKFAQKNPSWVIEGCYLDLIELLAKQADEIIFMNLDADQCIENAKSRPWEPHKYPSKQAQDENLDMLIEWIREYYQRSGEFSHAAHLKFFEEFDGKKTMITSNEELTDLA